MAISRSPGCNCCGAAPPEPCDCCVDRELKPLPVKTGTSFTDTTWDDDWVGVNDKSSNTLPANTLAYVDVTMSCQSNFSVEVEVIDFGVNEGAKIWVDGMMAECYRTGTADGKSLVVAVSSGLSYGIGSWTGPSFAGPRYADLIFSNRDDDGGVQRVGVGLLDTNIQRYDNGENFFTSQITHSQWATSQSALGPQTIRINIETSSSEIQIGQVRVRYGWSSCQTDSYTDDGSDTTFCYASRGMSIVNSGAQNLTITETSTGVTNDYSPAYAGQGPGFCTEPDPNPCATWINTQSTDYTPLNGTFYFELERETNFWESRQVPYPDRVYESANWADVNSWLDSVYAWSWSESERPISFWEYSQVDPEVEVTSGSSVWDRNWGSLTLGGPICGIITITERIIEPYNYDCKAFAERYNAPVAVTAPRQGSLLQCGNVNICIGNETAYPAFRLTGCSEAVTQARFGVALESDIPDAQLPDFVVPAINLSVDQDTYECGYEYSGNWNYTVVRGGFTMTRTKSNAVESFQDLNIGGKRDVGILKNGTITDFSVTDVAASETATQTGDSYVPQTLTFNTTGFPAGCEPDVVYKFGTPTYTEATWTCENVKSSPWLRIDTDDGESWDVAISANISSIDIRVRRYSDCEEIFYSDPTLSLPADKCNTVPISISTASFSVSFNWRVA